jgi:agmatine/peptidylarginine deiminase
MARKLKGPEVLTANELLSGRIVFWTGSGWGGDIHAATRATDDDVRAALAATGKAEEATNHVVAAYLVEIDGSGTPVELRERRRLAGPSILLPTPIRTAA